MSMDGKTMLITAAGQGMGRASAVALAEAGATVIAADINGDLLDQLPDVEGRLSTVRLDVTDGDAILELAEKTQNLDGLFNVAGMVHHGTILEMDDAAWDQSVSLNITSMVRMTRAFLPGMLARATETGSVSILNMASMASSVKGFTNRTAYGATKAAVIGLTKAVAADFVSQGLRCNALCPGTIDTPSLQGRIDAVADPVQAKKDFIARQPMGRLGTVEDMVPMIRYLLSQDSGFVTGQAFLVDGGVTI
ncbi:MAG: SDR family oxidoreductase [Sulfitobacter sp.]